AKCRELLDRNPGARFCAVSFTEKSVRDLKESLTSKLEGVELSDHWVKTIHGLCASIIQEFPAAAGMQGGERILVEDEAARLWRRSLDVLWSSNENPGISAALERLLTQYKREPLEKLFLKLRSLQSFGVEEFIQRSFHRQEVADLWLVFQSIDHRYRHSKNRDGALDFNDLELLAARALRSEVVRRYFQQRFDLVLVDEFQDTNPLQGAILEAFARSGLTNLCIVGDPKQSIYRFRDADVTVFRELTARLPGKHFGARLRATDSEARGSERARGFNPGVGAGGGACGPFDCRPRRRGRSLGICDSGPLGEKPEDPEIHRSTRGEGNPGASWKRRTVF
ncbi:hypothetical protein EB061_04845, partial [bacterium]|nr:hypothetical protein [bacterium]